jgi:hypothetical protein
MGVAKHAGDAIDRRSRRLVSDEMGDELRRDKARGGRMAAKRADTRSPSSSPSSPYFTPRTVFVPGSCSSV